MLPPQDADGDDHNQKANHVHNQCRHRTMTKTKPAAPKVCGDWAVKRTKLQCPQCNRLFNSVGLLQTHAASTCRTRGRILSANELLEKPTIIVVDPDTLKPVEQLKLTTKQSAPGIRIRKTWNQQKQNKRAAK